jgi:hypothetical protein
MVRSAGARGPTRGAALRAVSSLNAQLAAEWLIRWRRLASYAESARRWAPGETSPGARFPLWPNDSYALLPAGLRNYDRTRVGSHIRS